MTKVIELKFPERRKPPVDALVRPGQILFFTGVRYERDREVVEVDHAILDLAETASNRLAEQDQTERKQA